MTTLLKIVGGLPRWSTTCSCLSMDSESCDVEHGWTQSFNQAGFSAAMDMSFTPTSGSYRQIEATLVVPADAVEGQYAEVACEDAVAGARVKANGMVELYWSGPGGGGAFGNVSKGRNVCFRAAGNYLAGSVGLNCLFTEDVGGECEDTLRGASTSDEFESEITAAFSTTFDAVFSVVQGCARL